MDRMQKEAFVADLNATASSAELVVVSHYRGLTVAQMTDLRLRMRSEGGSIKVAKNRLAKIAFKGTPYTNLDDLMVGPTVVAMSSDPVAAARVAHNFAKENKQLVIIGGAMGETKLDEAGIKALASMPSLDELRAKIVGLIAAPATKIATVLQEPAAKTARVISRKPEAA